MTPKFDLFTLRILLYLGGYLGVYFYRKCLDPHTIGVQRYYGGRGGLDH